MLDIIRNKAQSWGTKLIFGIIILVFIFWGVGNIGSGGRNTIASVNGEDITVSAFMEAINREISANREKLRTSLSSPQKQRQFKYELLRSMALDIALKQEAERLGIFVSPYELRQVLSTVPLFQNSEGKFDSEKYISILKQQNISPGQFEYNYSQNLLKDKLQQNVLMSVAVTDEEVKDFFYFVREQRTAEYILFPTKDYEKEAAPTEEELQKYYETNKENLKKPARGSFEYIKLSPDLLAANYSVSAEEIDQYYEENKSKYLEPEQFNIRQIILSLPAESSSTDANAKAKNALIIEKLKKVHDEIVKGADFAQKAKEVSEDPAVATTGGSIGWVEKGLLPKEFDVAMSNLKTGEISDVLVVGKAAILIKQEGHRQEKLKPIDTVSSSIKSEVAKNKAIADFSSIQSKAENALSEGKNFAVISKELSSPVLQSGLIPLDTVGTVLGLNDTDVKSLLYVPAGKVAPSPFDTENSSTLVYVKEIFPEEIPSFEQIKDTIFVTLTNEKAMDLARQNAQSVLKDAVSGKLPEKYATKIALTSVAVDRFSSAIAPLGVARSLIQAMFSFSQDQWLPDAYDVSTGVVIARVKNINNVSKEELSAMKNLFTQTVSQQKQESALLAYMDNLIKKADFKPNLELIEKIPVR